METDVATTPTSAPPAVPAFASASPVLHKRRDDIAEGFKNRTAGEAKFNFRTYIGLGYVGSIAATIGLTWALRDTAFWPKFQKLNNAIANATKGGKTGKALENHIGNIDSLMTIGSMFTGTSLMAVLPIKWRENRKSEIIREYDRQIYGEERNRTDPELIQAHAIIDAAPKQTWGSILSSRALAFAATLGTAQLIGSNASKFGKLGYSIDRWSIQAGRKIDRALSFGDKEVGAQIDRAIATSPNELARAAVSGTGMPQVPDRIRSRLANYLMLDGLYTIMTSGILYVFTRILAPVFDKHSQAVDAAPIALASNTLPAIAAAPLPPIAGPAPATTVSHAQHDRTAVAHHAQASL